ncbi:MAG: PilZ domain-containing protein [Candidatus Omnitrophica bacterium]|nr:PilZ domain-containing protein [Candidatus Omnitrophota bacterium]
MDIEKRRCLRFNLPGRADVTFDRSPSSCVVARTQDFSRQGISIETEDFDMKDSKTVQMEITPGWETDEKFSLEGNVIWQRMQGNRCVLGVSIEKMDAQKKNDLLERSYYLWQTISNLK